jgi:raffinose/stachyose/melibiose transport system substrate-binding protein
MDRTALDTTNGTDRRAVPARTGTIRRAMPRSALAAALLIMGLGGGAASTGGTTRAAAPATLRIWYGTDDPTESSLAQSIASRFQAAHQGVTVKVSTYGLDDINNKLSLAISAGAPPDLIYTTPRGPGLPVYVRAGKLLDLTTAARQNHWDTGMQSGMLAAYNDLLTPNGRAAGHVYAVPSLNATVAIIYNTAIFQRLHLNVPHSLADFETLCRKVRVAGLTAIGFGNADGWVGDDWYLTLVNAIAGPSSLQPELRLDPRFKFDEPAFLTAGATMQRWADLQYFTPQFGGLDAQDSVDSFFDGKTAMQLISSTQNGQITTLARQSHVPIGVFAFPSANARRRPVMPDSGYAGWAVPSAGRQPALAEAFITWMLGDDAARQLAAHGLLPARQLTAAEIRGLSSFQQQYLRAEQSATPGVYLDGAPVPNLNATMEANVQLLLHHFENPAFLVKSLQLVYDSHGARASSTRTDGEF